MTQQIINQETEELKTIKKTGLPVQINNAGADPASHTTGIK